MRRTRWGTVKGKLEREGRIEWERKQQLNKEVKYITLTQDGTGTRLLRRTIEAVEASLRLILGMHGRKRRLHA